MAAAKLGIEAGQKLHATYADDGEYYPAVVVATSTAKARSKKPVKITYNGYPEEVWVSIDALKSKKLGLAPKSAPEPKAKAKGKAKAKAKATSAPEPKAKAKSKAKAKAKVKAKKERPASAAGQFKVCVCGGAGGIGQPLSMLMALDERVGELSVFDLDIAVVPAAGVAADLGHLERPSKVKAYSLDLKQKPVEELSDCLTGCHLVLVPAGLPRKPGMTRADLLATNAGIAKGIVEACAKFCPDAVVALIVNPVNSVVPAMAELYKKAGKDPAKIVGVTTLDIVRANKFVHEASGVSLKKINVPVIGGHAGTTILPLFSQVPACKDIAADKLVEMDKRTQDAGTEVVNAKNGKGSATLSMAYAGARLGKAVLAGLSGKKGVKEFAYVQSTIREGVGYFASKVIFGKGGVEKVLDIGTLSEHETTRLNELTPALKEEIQAGLDYAAGESLAC